MGEISGFQTHIAHCPSTSLDYHTDHHYYLLDIMAESDLILDEGFPVLSDFKPGSSEADRFPLPRSPFSSYTNAITFAQRSSFLNDCALVFNARATDGDEYSSGSTFFLPCLMKPRCCLEALAQTIFKAHTDGLEGKFDPKNSGAEWWTLVLDNKSTTKDNLPPSKEADDDNGDDDSEDEEDDEVGMHFDADYALEEQASGVFLHPRVATITYLSDVGVPTLILDKRSPPPQDFDKSSLNGSIKKGWLSHPSFGKHVSFDGRLLHGAPGEYFPNTSTPKSNDDDVSEPQTKKQKVEEKVEKVEGGELVGKRITFLVNIWLNHSTMDAVILDDDLVSKLACTWEDPDSNAKSDEAHAPAFQWNIKDVTSEDKLTRTVSLTKSSEAGGTEDIVLCNRHVDMVFHSSMGDLHAASKLAAKEGSMPIVLEDGALTLTVGREASDEEDDGSEED